jgi:cbb3-type cytochrome oxidase maturation protein
MDILYVLIPLSAMLVLGILAVFSWALTGGQFDDLEQQGEQILLPEPQGLIAVKVPMPLPPNNPSVAIDEQNGVPDGSKSSASHRRGELHR